MKTTADHDRCWGTLPAQGADRGSGALHLAVQLLQADYRQAVSPPVRDPRRGGTRRGDGRQVRHLMEQSGGTDAHTVSTRNLDLAGC